MEGWRVGGLRVVRVEGWRVGGLEGRVGGFEGWKVGRLEGRWSWKVGGLDPNSDPISGNLPVNYPNKYWYVRF